MYALQSSNRFGRVICGDVMMENSRSQPWREEKHKWEAASSTVAHRRYSPPLNDCLHIGGKVTHAVGCLYDRKHTCQTICNVVRLTSRATRESKLTFAKEVTLHAFDQAP